MGLEARSSRRRTLAWRVAGSVAVATLCGFLVFGVVAYLVVVAQEESEPEAAREGIDVIRQEALEEVGFATLVGAPVGFGLTVVAAFLLTRRALQPIDALVKSAAVVTTRDFHRRLPVPETEGEVRALALTLNELLSRLEAGFAAESRFAADASHELRTPLTVIATELDVALQRPRSREEWQAAARNCLDETRHLAALVDSLLAMARAERSALGAPSTVSLRSVVARALRVHASRSASCGVTLRGPHDDGQDIEVFGDADTLASAISNVIENAVDHAPSGSDVVVSMEVASADRVVVHVDDHGPGVAPADRERIFQPFARAAAVAADRAAPSSTGVGLGLGLAIARRSIERQGGTVSVTNAPTGGARFSVALPLASN